MGAVMKLLVRICYLLLVNSAICDILFNPRVEDKEETEGMLYHPKRAKREVIDSDSLPCIMWNGTIPYKINTTLIEEPLHVQMIETSISEWQNRTCVTFTKLADSDSPASQYVLFTRTGQGQMCNSYLGRQPEHNLLPQVINLEKNCFSKLGIIHHQIGHVLGLTHEHQRPDRDNYVVITVSNIKPGMADDFAKDQDVMTEGIPYRFDSIMHYESVHLSISPFTKKYTILPKNSDHLFSMGQQSQITFYDVKTVNMAYCADRCTQELPCENDGYPDPNDCSKCVCPEEWTGRYCNEIPTPTECTPESGIKTVSDENTTYSLLSPYYERKLYEPGDKCFWLLKAPEGKVFRFWFDKVNFYNVVFGLPELATGTCIFWLEVKSPVNSQGRRFCGVFSGNPPSFEYYSATNEAYVVFLSFKGILNPPLVKYSVLKRGFKLQYQLVDAPTSDTVTQYTTSVMNSGTNVWSTRRAACNLVSTMDPTTDIQQSNTQYNTSPMGKTNYEHHTETDSTSPESWQTNVWYTTSSSEYVSEPHEESTLFTRTSDMDSAINIQQTSTQSMATLTPDMESMSVEYYQTATTQAIDMTSDERQTDRQPERTSIVNSTTHTQVTSSIAGSVTNEYQAVAQSTVPSIIVSRNDVTEIDTQTKTITGEVNINNIHMSFTNNGTGAYQSHSLVLGISIGSILIFISLLFLFAFFLVMKRSISDDDDNDDDDNGNAMFYVQNIYNQVNVSY